MPTNPRCAAAHDILPERTLYRLRMDHPVFHSFYDIDKVAYRDRMVKDGLATDPHPWIEGIDIDNRTAIFVSRWDFSLGWEANQHDSWGYADTDARKLGANIVSYVTAMRDAGRSVGKSVELVNARQKDRRKIPRRPGHPRRPVEDAHRRIPDAARINSTPPRAHQSPSSCAT